MRWSSVTERGVISQRKYCHVQITIKFYRKVQKGKREREERKYGRTEKGKRKGEKRGGREEERERGKEGRKKRK